VVATMENERMSSLVNVSNPNLSHADAMTDPLYSKFFAKNGRIKRRIFYARLILLLAAPSACTLPPFAICHASGVAPTKVFATPGRS
jgi:hypothetical protein